LRDGAGGGIGLERIVSVCNIIGHQEVEEVVLWAPTFPTHLDPPSSYHQLVESGGGGGHICVVCTYVHLHPSTSRYMCTCMKAYQDNSSWFLGAVGAVDPCHVVLSTHLVPPALHWAVFFCIILLSSQPYMSSSSTYSSPPAHKASG
jgi:hypothetical protein